MARALLTGVRLVFGSCVHFFVAVGMDSAASHFRARTSLPGECAGIWSCDHPNGPGTEDVRTAADRAKVDISAKSFSVAVPPSRMGLLASPAVREIHNEVQNEFPRCART